MSVEVVDGIRADAVINNLVDGVIAVDSSRTIALVNPSAEIIMERGAASVRGRKIEEAELHPEIVRVVLECVETGAPTETEVKLGGWPHRFISVTTRPVFDQSGDLSFAMVNLHDITRVRQYENAQREFVGNVSHELKTPLTAVRATAEVLLSGAKNDEVLSERFLNTIISESDRLATLVDELLELARLDAGMALSNQKVAGVLDIANRAAKAVSQIVTDRGISLKIHIDPNLSTFCDDVQMVLALRNLIENSVKYSNDGGKVDVRAEVDGDMLLIRVLDAGIGIAKKDLDQIFERFYRVDKSRGRVTGTGLGLSIVKSIVEAHGGSVLVESNLGHGSTFTIALPNTWTAADV